MTEAGYPNGFKVAMAFTNDRLPGDRQVGTAVAQMLATRIGIDIVAGKRSRWRPSCRPATRANSRWR